MKELLEINKMEYKYRRYHIRVSGYFFNHI